MTRMATFWGMAAAVLVAGCSTEPAVWSADVRSLTLTYGAGGPSPPSIPTSECPHESLSYTLTVHPAVLDGTRCVAPSYEVALPIVRTTASVALSAEEFDALVPSLERLRVVDDGACGADKPAARLTVTRTSGTAEYRDAFYNGCPGEDHLPAIDARALDAVAAAFYAVVGPRLASASR